MAERSWAFSSSKFFMAHRCPHKTNKQTKILPKADSAPRPQDTTCKPACSFLCGWGHFHFLPRHLRVIALTRPLAWNALPSNFIMPRLFYPEGDLSLNNTQLFLSPSSKTATPHPQEGCHRCCFLSSMPLPRGHQLLSINTLHSAHHIVGTAFARFCGFSQTILPPAPTPNSLPSDCRGNPHLWGSPFLGLQRQAWGLKPG